MPSTVLTYETLSTFVSSHDDRDWVYEKAEQHEPLHIKADLSVATVVCSISQQQAPTLSSQDGTTPLYD